MSEQRTSELVAWLKDRHKSAALGYHPVDRPNVLLEAAEMLDRQAEMLDLCYNSNMRREVSMYELVNEDTGEVVAVYETLNEAIQHHAKFPQDHIRERAP